ncbi:hypothetical protein NX059_002916 [Plenodomus lindquistii]|nr:hypothetical protein NX059_002916 [Plenodomus lindquistii]
MKLATFFLALFATMVAALDFLPGESPDADALELTARATDCDACTRSYNFCVDNGHTEGQTGCKQTCREHVCYQNAGCRSCGDPFDKCPEKSRYLMSSH